MRRPTVAVAVLLLGTLACVDRGISGGATTGGSAGASTSGGVTSTGGSTAGSTTGGSTTGQTIGKPKITGPGTEPNPCEVDFDFGNLAIGQTTSETFTVSNSGNGALDLLSFAPSLDPAFGLSYTPPSPIPPSGQFQFSVSFSPTSQGQVVSSFSIPTDGVNPLCPAPTGTGDSSLTVQLMGTGILPCLQVEPTALDFGNTLVNTSNKKSVTLKNVCTGSSSGIVATIAGVDSNLFVVDNSPTSLAANSQATVDLTYSPLALETQSTASVTFADSNDHTAILNLVGEPIGVALTLVSNPIDCGSVPVGTIVTCCTTVTDQANVEVDIDAIVQFATSGGAFGLASTDDATPGNPITYPIAIAEGGSAKVCFSFSPSLAQQYSGQATLQTNDPSGTNPVVQLVGTGTN